MFNKTVLLQLSKCSLKHYKQNGKLWRWQQLKSWLSQLEPFSAGKVKKSLEWWPKGSSFTIRQTINFCPLCRYTRRHLQAERLIEGALKCGCGAGLVVKRVSFIKQSWVRFLMPPKTFQEKRLLSNLISVRALRKRIEEQNNLGYYAALMIRA